MVYWGGHFEIPGVLEGLTNGLHVRKHVLAGRYCRW